MGNGYWLKREYDEKGNVFTLKIVMGEIIGERVKMVKE